jgi:hypothetical protein
MVEAKRIQFRLLIVVATTMLVSTTAKAGGEESPQPTEEAPPTSTPALEPGENGSDGPSVDGGDTPSSKPSEGLENVSDIDTQASAEDPPASVVEGEIDDDRALPTLTFLGFERSPEHEREARLVEDFTQSALLNDPRIALSTAHDIDEALSRAADHQQEGCTVAVESCARSVALALGARYVLTGSVAVTDGSIIVDLVLLDTLAGIPTSRERITARRIEGFQRRLSQTLTNLLLVVHGGPRIPIDEERPVRAFDDADVLIGATTLGVMTATLVGISALAIGGIVLAGAAFPDAYLPWGVPLLAAGLATPVLGGMLALAVAIVVDLVAGAPVVWIRPVALAAASAALLVVAFPVASFSAINLITSTMAALDFARNPNDEFQFDNSYILPTVTVVALATLGISATTGVLSAALSLGTFALTESTPPFGEE